MTEFDKEAIKRIKKKAENYLIVDDLMKKGFLYEEMFIDHFTGVRLRTRLERIFALRKKFTGVWTIVVKGAEYITVSAYFSPSNVILFNEISIETYEYTMLEYSRMKQWEKTKSEKLAEENRKIGIEKRRVAAEKRKIKLAEQKQNPIITKEVVKKKKSIWRPTF